MKWEQEVMTYFKVYCQHLLGIKENETPQLRKLVSG